ncbi:MAG: hypothetical protein K9J12_01175 [Melioribacteraceae bacterium]|nr:hypothetical protein [Melioribacteraceae bacterium]MCF8263942.1 hypothetical protein [Melioribacteraceae bacterium]MCF8432392.1 hypothetical protein [Melioribacteraceae bacterium]
MKHADNLFIEKDQFFDFFKEQYHIYFNSNIFLRDILYSVRRYFEKKGEILSYSDAEKITNEFTQKLESENLLLRLDNNSWRVNFMKPESVVEELKEVTE